MVMEILLWIGVFVVAIAVLIKSSDYFTEAAEKIGLLLGIPSFIVGVTIVAVGTSLPELISSIFAVSSGNSEIVIGNVLGSNIANIMLILGVVAIFAKKIETNYDLLKVDLPIFFASALFIFLTCADGVFTIWEGLIGIAGVVTYFVFLSTHMKVDVTKKKFKWKSKDPKDRLMRQFIIVVVSGFFIFIGAKFTIDSVVRLSEIFNIGKELIALSAVAIGTSLPELIVGIKAAKRGNAGMAFGNVLGSNIFNSFAVMGIPALIGAITVPASLISFSIPVMIGASILYFFMIQDRQLTIWEGIILLLAYVLYIGKVFGGF